MMKHLEEVRGAMIPAYYLYTDNWWCAAELIEIIKNSPESDRFISQKTPSEIAWEEDNEPFELVLEDRVYKIFSLEAAKKRIKEELNKEE